MTEKNIKNRIAYRLAAWAENIWREEIDRRPLKPADALLQQNTPQEALRFKKKKKRRKKVEFTQSS